MDSTSIWDWSHTSQETTERQTGVENNPQYDALRDCSESLGQWQCLMRYLSNWIFIRRQCQHALGSGIAKKQLFVELECMPAAQHRSINVERDHLVDWTRGRRLQLCASGSITAEFTLNGWLRQIQGGQWQNVPFPLVSYCMVDMLHVIVDCQWPSTAFQGHGRGLSVCLKRLLCLLKTVLTGTYK